MPPNSENSFGGSPRIQNEPSGSKRAVLFCASTGIDDKTSKETRNGFTQRRKAVHKGTKKDVISFFVALVLNFVPLCEMFLSIDASESGYDCGSGMIFWVA